MNDNSSDDAVHGPSIEGTNTREADSLAQTTSREERPLEEGLATAYRTLGMVYLEPPTEMLIETLRAWQQNLQHSELPRELDEALQTLAVATDDIESLRPTYARLFQGLARGYSPPPPYESVYRDGRIQGPSSVEVERQYAAANLAYDDSPDKVDHLGVELYFLAHLCEMEKTEAQREFLEDHLLRWVWEFHEAAAEYDVPSFYRGVFGVTEVLIGMHYEYIAKEEDE